MSGRIFMAWTVHAWSTKRSYDTTTYAVEVTRTKRFRNWQRRYRTIWPFLGPRQHLTGLFPRLACPQLTNDVYRVHTVFARVVAL